MRGRWNKTPDPYSASLEVRQATPEALRRLQFCLENSILIVAVTGLVERSNTSIIDSDNLLLRIGLIPLAGEVVAGAVYVLELRAINDTPDEIVVYSESLRLLSGPPIVPKRGIPIVTLGCGQNVHVKVYAEANYGSAHSRFNPVCQASFVYRRRWVGGKETGKKSSTWHFLGNELVPRNLLGRVTVEYDFTQALFMVEAVGQLTVLKLFQDVRVRDIITMDT